MDVGTIISLSAAIVMITNIIKTFGVKPEHGRLAVMIVSVFMTIMYATNQGLSLTEQKNWWVLFTWWLQTVTGSAGIYSLAKKPVNMLTSMAKESGAVVKVIAFFALFGVFATTAKAQDSNLGGAWTYDFLHKEAAAVATAETGIAKNVFNTRLNVHFGGFAGTTLKTKLAVAGIYGALKFPAGDNLEGMFGAGWQHSTGRKSVGVLMAGVTYRF